MHRFFLIATIFSISLYCRAQSSYFVYLQAEPPQSFTVTYKEQVFRSSASGYLILPNLTDSSLQLVVDFPGQKNISYPFLLSTQRNDQGYLLKNYGEKGWGLLDWRKLTVLYVDRPGPAKFEKGTSIAQDDFSKLLAKASGDSTLLVEAPIANAGNKSSKPLADSSLALERKPAALPSYCKSILTEAEFKEGLSHVQAAKSEISKVNVLKEFIASRCYTIDQVKAFALLLITDEVKYDFLLEAWAQTADRTNYLSLSTVFSNVVTADRFKEMFQ